MARWRVKLASDESTPAMARASKALSPAARAVLHKAAAQPLLGVVRRHLAELAQSRHASADALGARPTDAIGRAARRSTSSADAEAASVTIPSPLFTRAFRDVTILPSPPRKALALPLHKWAYGVSPRDWDARRKDRPLVYIPGRGGRNPILATSYKKTLTPMYVLVARVRQKQDRSLLPSDNALLEAAAEGVTAVIAAAISRARGGAA